MCPVIRVLGVFVPVRITEDDRSEPMSSQPNGAWLTQDAYDRLAKELAELEGPGRTEIAERIAAARDEGDLKENGG
jgi:transcription elongation factor GreA